MIGLGLNATKTPTVNTNIVRDALVLRHDYKDRPVELCSSGAASFNGSSDYVDLGSKTSTTNMTFSAWINKTDDGYNPIFRYGKSLVTFIDGDTFRFWGNSASSATTTNGIDINNTWVHFAVTLDGTSGSVYQDGVLVTTATIAAADTSSSAASYIGRSGSNYFKGYICNAGVWSEALTQPQIKSIMNKDYAALSASEKDDLVSWWNLDEETNVDGTAGTGGVKDYHGSNHGTLA